MKKLAGNSTENPKKQNLIFPKSTAYEKLVFLPNNETPRKGQKGTLECVEILSSSKQHAINQSSKNVPADDRNVIIIDESDENMDEITYPSRKKSNLDDEQSNARSKIVHVIQESDSDDLPEIIAHFKPSDKAEVYKSDDEDDDLPPLFLGNSSTNVPSSGVLFPSVSSKEQPKPDEWDAIPLFKKSRKSNSEFSLDKLINQKPKEETEEYELENFRRQLEAGTVTISSCASFENFHDVDNKEDKELENRNFIAGYEMVKDKWPMAKTIKNVVLPPGVHLEFIRSYREFSSNDFNLDVVLNRINVETVDIEMCVEDKDDENPFDMSALTRILFDIFVYLKSFDSNFEEMMRILKICLSVALDYRFIDESLLIYDFQSLILSKTSIDQQLNMAKQLTLLTLDESLRCRLLSLIPKSRMRESLAWRYLTTGSPHENENIFKLTPSEILRITKNLSAFQVSEQSDYRMLRYKCSYLWYSLNIPAKKGKVWEEWGAFVRGIGKNIRDNKGSYLDRTAAKDSFLMFEILFP